MTATVAASRIDPEEKLQTEKRTKRTIEQLITPNWEVDDVDGSRATITTVNGSDSDSDTGGGGGGGGSKKKKIKKEAPVKKPGAGARGRRSKNHNVERRKNFKFPFAGPDTEPQEQQQAVQASKKKKVAGNVPSNAMVTAASQFEYRPLEDFVTCHVLDKTATTEELHSQVLMDLTRSIDGKRTTAPGGDIIRVASNVSKRKRTRLAESVTAKLSLEKRDAKELFFNDDNFLTNPRLMPYIEELREEARIRNLTFISLGGKLFPPDLELTIEDLPKVSRAYNADYRREASPGNPLERPCRRGRKCIHMVLNTVFPNSVEKDTQEEGFICREWRTPEQAERCDREKVCLPEQQNCYDCGLFITNLWFYWFLQEGVEPYTVKSENKKIGMTKRIVSAMIPQFMLLQDHEVLVNQTGEYSLVDCLPTSLGDSVWTGIARPYPKFSATRYVYGKVRDPYRNGHELKCAFEQNMGFQIASVTASASR